MTFHKHVAIIVLKLFYPGGDFERKFPNRLHFSSLPLSTVLLGLFHREATSLTRVYPMCVFKPPILRQNEIVCI